MYASYVPQHLTDPLWQRLANAKLFITGGTGLFGHWLLDSLTDANQRLNLKISATVLTRHPGLAKDKMPYLDSQIQFLHGYVENFKFPTEKFDVILHMATTSAEETFQGFSQTQKLQTLFEGTQRVIELAHKCGAKRILFTSSGAVYGNQLCDFIQESSLMQIDPLNSESGLALGKSVAEFLLRQASAESSLEIVIARCFAFVGPGIPINLHYAIGNFIKNAAEGKPILIKGDGTAIRSYMFLGDLVWWLLQLLLDGKSGDAYNVGSDQPISISELAQKVALLSMRSPKILIQGQANYSVGVPVSTSYIPTIEKAKLELGLHISTDLSSAIAQTLNSLRQFD
jgi:nucleoside-diphosphate-sugar epimerase